MIADDHVFIDYYDVLQVDPACDAKTLESAYHELAKSYHPDYSGTADTTKIKEVIEAYRVLRNPRRRVEYDRLYAEQTQEHESEVQDEERVQDKSALEDSDAHARILKYLYERRRQQAQNPGVVAYYLQEMLNCTDEHFEFHKWYLREKGLISITEQGTLAITIQGVDHVISTARTSREKLRIGQSNGRVD